MSALNKMMGFLGLVDTDEETAAAQTPAAHRPLIHLARRG